MYSSISITKSKPNPCQATRKKFQQNKPLKNGFKSLTKFLFFCVRYTTVAQGCAASISKEYCLN